MHRLKFRLYAAAIAIAALSFACKPKPLPESGTAAERVYAARCGGCHRPYNPRSMTAAMWQMQVAAMEQKIAQAGQPPLTGDQKERILAYLQRNAGTR